MMMKIAATMFATAQTAAIGDGAGWTIASTFSAPFEDHYFKHFGADGEDRSVVHSQRYLPTGGLTPIEKVVSIENVKNKELVRKNLSKEQRPILVTNTDQIEELKIQIQELKTQIEELKIQKDAITIMDLVLKWLEVNVLPWHAQAMRGLELFLKVLLHCAAYYFQNI